MRALAVFVACVLIVAGEDGVRASDDDGLRWQAPASCPDRGEIAARLAARSAHAAAVDAGVRIEELADGSLIAVVELPGGEHRELRGADCSALSDAALVVLSLALGWTANDRAQEPHVVAAPAPAPAATIRVTPAPAARSGPPSLAVFVGGDADYGVLPDTALAASAGFGAETRGWRLRLVGRWLRGEVSESADPDVRGGRFELLAGELDLCRRIVAPLWACAGGSAGRLRATGFGVREPQSPSSSWLALEAGLELRAPLGGDFELVLGARGSAPLRRDRYRFENHEPLHQVSRVTARLMVGIAWSFFAPDPPTRPTQSTEAAHARSDL